MPLQICVRRHSIRLGVNNRTRSLIATTVDIHHIITFVMIQIDSTNIFMPRQNRCRQPHAQPVMFGYRVHTKIVVIGTSVRQNITILHKGIGKIGRKADVMGKERIRVGTRAVAPPQKTIAIGRHSIEIDRITVVERTTARHTALQRVRTDSSDRADCAASVKGVGLDADDCTLGIRKVHPRRIKT